MGTNSIDGYLYSNLTSSSWRGFLETLWTQVENVLYWTIVCGELLIPQACLPNISIPNSWLLSRCAKAFLFHVMYSGNWIISRSGTRMYAGSDTKCILAKCNLLTELFPSVRSRIVMLCWVVNDVMLGDWVKWWNLCWISDNVEQTTIL